MAGRREHPIPNIEGKYPMKEITATMRQLLDQIGLNWPARQSPPPTLTLRRPA
jgi:hypothetical protein